MKYELKPITLMQRAEINDALLAQKSFTAFALACKYGLKSLNEKNPVADEQINELSIDDITEIGTKVIEGMNFPPQKSSS